MYANLFNEGLEKKLSKIKTNEIFPKTGIQEISSGGIGLEKNTLSNFNLGDNLNYDFCKTCRHYTPPGVTSIRRIGYNPCLGRKENYCINYVNVNNLNVGHFVPLDTKNNFLNLDTFPKIPNNFNFYV